MIVKQSGSVIRFGKFLITRESNVFAEPKIHRGNVRRLGKSPRYRCLIELVLVIRLSLSNQGFNILQFEINKVCNLGKLYRGKASRLPHD
jgi:hypothetical protein